MCPDIYSTISGSNGTRQDSSFCSQVVNDTGMFVIGLRLCSHVYTVFGNLQFFDNYDMCPWFIDCPMEQDSTWNITWPATSVGDTAIQKCPGGSEAEGS